MGDAEDRRKVLEESYALHEAEGTVAEEPVATGPETPPEQEGEHEQAAEGESTDEAAGDSARTRDERGRFAKTDEKAGGKAAEQGARTDGQQGQAQGDQRQPVVQKPGQADQQGAPQLRPPESWRALAREDWDKLPRNVQQEAIRIHNAFNRSFQETAPLKQFHEQYQKTLAQYEPMFRQFGAEPMQGLQYLANAYRELNFAPAPRRVDIIADLIRTSLGVNEQTMSALADALDGKGGGGRAAPAAQQIMDPAAIAQQVTQNVMQQFQGQAQQQALQSGMSELEQFESTEPEFLEQVRDRMAYILDSDAAWKDSLQSNDPRRVALSAEDAYAMACNMDEEIAQVLRQRDEAEAATARNAAMQRSRVVAGSVQSEAGGVEPVDDSRLGALKRAYEAVEGR